MNAIILVDNRALGEHLNIHLGFSATREAVEAVLNYGLYLEQHRCPHDPDHFQDHLQHHYLELVESGRHDRLIDHVTGEVEDHGWYAHYVETAWWVFDRTISQLKPALQSLFMEHGVSYLEVVRLTPTFVIAKATCHLLIPDLRRG